MNAMPPRRRATSQRRSRPGDTAELSPQSGSRSGSRSRSGRLPTLLAVGCCLSLLLVARQTGLWAQMHELAALLAEPEIVVNELPMTLPACDPPGQEAARAAPPLAPSAVADVDLLEDAEREIAELRERLARAEGELVQARAVSRQLRAGLAEERGQRGRARSASRRRATRDPIAAIGQQLEALGVASPPTATDRGFAAQFRVGRVKVQFLGSDAWITGTVTSRADRDLQPLIVVELLRDGRVEGVREVRLQVAAGATAAFEARLPTQLAEGTYSAQARVEP
ncbi:MAG: hypothetical protein DWQ36_24055 [Acidobacteria bacterium]|mgnify:FL=1|nr:MAG: hypothetical protein DWQ30_07250 [Acidobacteriota bacterium]REK00224.1 MAG: hypothetical protein DWQ36_24055 [Acidobacteriota bacterium]